MFISIIIETDVNDNNAGTDYYRDDTGHDILLWQSRNKEDIGLDW